ncbi:MAG: paraquat-inducible protein A [Rhizobiaceae bacterium]
MRIFIGLLLFVAIFCFALGITLPVLHVQKLYFFEETPSILSLTYNLWQEGSALLALVVVGFSVFFPMLKLGIVLITAVAPKAELAHSPLIRWAGVLSKWSMMDVLLVALVITAAKTSGLAEAVVQPGLWFYASSALCGAIAAGLLKGSPTASAINS